VPGCSCARLAEVMLAPMEVHAIKQELSDDLRASLSHPQLGWREEKGVSALSMLLVERAWTFFSARPLAGGGRALLFYNDQRKVVTISLGAPTARALLDKA